MEKLPFFQRPLRFQFYNAALIIIGINVLIYFAGSALPELSYRLALIPAAVIELNWYWTPFTYMFVHGSLGHLFGNMLGLFFFGIQLERRIGSNEFLLFYLLSGALAGLLSFALYVLTGTYNVALVGASGAVLAVLLAFATYFPSATVLLYFVLPIRASILAIGYAAFTVIAAVSRSGGNVAHMTHLFGFAIAFLYLVVRLRINPITAFRDSSRY